MRTVLLEDFRQFPCLLNKCSCPAHRLTGVIAQVGIPAKNAMYKHATNRFRLRCYLALTLVFAVTPAFGDGLFRKLPPEGAWATFRMSEEWSNGTKRNIDVTLRAFGSEIVDGVDCRWIELELQTLDGKTRRAHRFLSPVAALETGADPLGTAIDVWVRNNDGEPRRDMSWDNFLPRLMIVCPPKIDKETVLAETEQIAIKEDSLLGKVVTGKGDQEFSRGTIAVASKYRLVTNDTLPFGVGSATLSITQRQNCDIDNPNAVCETLTGTVEFSLVAFGDKARASVDVANQSKLTNKAGGELYDGRDSPS